jgi:hypothetical protein
VIDLLQSHLQLDQLSLSLARTRRLATSASPEEVE